MPFIPKSSYYDQDYRQTAALIRARRPYLFKNIGTGVVIFGFAIAVYSWTIKAVGQDEFEDVKVPEAPSQPPKSPNVAFSRR